MENDSKGFEALKNSLPDLPDEPLVGDDGEESYRGFLGDCSGTPLYVTDGHLLLLASAVDPAFPIRRDDDLWARKYATQEGIAKVWDRIAARKSLPGEFIGSSLSGEFAFVRGERGRVMVVDAYKLAFAVKAVHPDELLVDAAPLAKLDDAAELAIRRGGELVGVLMPLRYRASHFPQYDLVHAPACDLTGKVRA